MLKEKREEKMPTCKSIQVGIGFAEEKVLTGGVLK